MDSLRSKDLGLLWSAGCGVLAGVALRVRQEGGWAPGCGLVAGSAPLGWSAGAVGRLRVAGA